MDKFNQKINEWLKSQNKPILEKHPLIWVHGYPWILLPFILVSTLSILLSFVPTQQSGTIEFYIQTFFAFFPLLLLWLRIFPGKVHILPSDFYTNKGLWIIKEENKKAMIDLVIFLVALFICLININIRYNSQPYASNQEYNKEKLFDYVKGEYFFLKNEGVSKEKSISIFRDSIYPFLEKDKFPPFNPTELDMQLNAVTNDNSYMILSKYSEALGLMNVKNDRLEQYSRPSYDRTVHLLNAQSAIKLPDFVFSLLITAAILIFYFSLVMQFFSGITDLYWSHSFHERIIWITMSLLLAASLLIFPELLKRDLNDYFIHVLDKVYKILKPILILYIKLFNVFSIPVFLYFYLNKFTAIKLELLDQFFRPKDPATTKSTPIP